MPREINVTMRCGPKPDAPNDMFLVFDILGGANPGGGSDYTVDLRCTLQDLLGTDVGKRLGLEGSLGGHLRGKATLFTENNALNIDVKGGSDDSYVIIDDPSVAKDNASEPPAHEPRKRIRQELPINFDCRASAQPGEKGKFSHALIESFSLSAPSIAAKSLIPAGIHNLDQPGKLEAEAMFKLELDGRRFCQNFAPILKLFGYTRPVEEKFDLEVKIYGKDDLVTMSAVGTAARQWNEKDPSPVALNSYVELNAHPAANPDGTPSPYLSLMLELASKVGKPLNVHLKADCSRDAKTETIGVEIYDRDPAKPDSADVSALRERFNPYIEAYLENYDALNGNEAKIVPLYRNTMLDGSLKPSGRVSLQRVLDPKSKDANRINFDISLAGKDFTVDMPWKTARARDDKPADGRFRWSESAASVSMKGAFQQRLSNTKEEPDILKLNLDALKVEGSLGKFVFTVRDLDLFKLANLATIQNQTWTDTADALSMSGQVDPPAYEFLRSLNIIPPDYPISGHLALKVGYDKKADTLDLQQFDFKQSKDRPDFFLSSLDVTGAVLNVRDLSHRLVPVAEGAPSFAENFSVLLDEGGPAALLDHLGDNLTVNNVQIETRPLVDWLCKDYRKPQPGHVPPALIAGLLRRDWQPEGTWSAAGIQLSRMGDPRTRTWKLLGGRIRNDLSVYGLAAKEGAPRPVAFSFTHDWDLKMGLALSADNTVALNGSINLDKAFVSALLPRFNYEYKKPAKEHCELQLKDCLYSHGRHSLAHIGSLELSGKPMGVVLNGLDVDISQARQGSFKIAELAIAGGPLPCGATDLQCDPAIDRLDMHFHAVDANLQYLAEIFRLPARFHPEGSLRDADLHYRGSLMAFQSAFVPESERAANFPGVAADDPRLAGLNPDTDSLEFDAQLKDVLVEAGEGDRKLKAALGGSLRLTGRDLMWKDFSADAECTSPVGVVRQTFSIPNLHVNSLDAKLSLSRAFRAPGMPLDISAPLIFTTPLNINAFYGAQSTLLEALNVPPPSGDENVRKLTNFEHLAVTGSFKAPAVETTAATLAFVEVQDFSMKNLKLTYPVLTTSLYGGKLTLTDAECDLTRARLTTANGLVGIEGVTHQEQLKLLDGDLAIFLGSIDPKDAKDGGYAVTGRVDLEGPLKGIDFAAEKRISWDGGVKCRLSKVAVRRIASQHPAKPEGLPPWMSAYFNMGDKFAAAFAAAAGHDSVSTDTLSAEHPAAGPLRNLNGLIAGIDLYLAKSFAVEQERWEFEDLTPTIVIGKGVATVQPISLIGKGALLGLELKVQSLGMNLTDNTIADTVLFPVSLPQTAQQNLALASWPKNEGKNYLNNMANGLIPLKIGGTVAVPTIKFPWTEVRKQGKLAILGTATIEDLPTLSAARDFLQISYPPEDREKIAGIADRLGIGLPGTITGHNQGEMIGERIVNLPKSLKDQLSYTTAAISPLQSLQLLLNPPPDAPVLLPPQK